MKEDRTEKVRLNIFGSNISINVPSGDRSYVEELGEYVNRLMIKLSEQSGSISTTKVAILVALNVADEYFSEKKKREKIEEELSRILNDKSDRIKKILKKNKK